MKPTTPKANVDIRSSQTKGFLRLAHSRVAKKMETTVRTPPMVGVPALD
jgi:hypothetical protein